MIPQEEREHRGVWTCPFTGATAELSGPHPLHYFWDRRRSDVEALPNSSVVERGEVEAATTCTRPAILDVLQALAFPTPCVDLGPASVDLYVSLTFFWANPRESRSGETTFVSKDSRHPPSSSHPLESEVGLESRGAGGGVVLGINRPWSGAGLRFWGRIPVGLSVAVPLPCLGWFLPFFRSSSLQRQQHYPLKRLLCALHHLEVRQRFERRKGERVALRGLLEVGG